MTLSNPERLSIGQCVSLACFLEATAPKPGNVHRGADFEDLPSPDLVISGILIAPILEQADQFGVGGTILRAVQATRASIGTNSNLGMILLMAPLAVVPRDISLQVGVAEVLSTLTPDDARLVYEAINHAKPGGMGSVAEADLAAAPPASLIDAMRLAEDRDLVARQYTRGYADVFQLVVPELTQGVAAGLTLSSAIVHAHVRLMSLVPDTLIARKCGPEIARQSALRAQEVLAAGAPGSDAYHDRLSDLDFWLRSDGHRRNPGTTADLIAAGLFACLRDDLIEPRYLMALSRS